MSQQLKKQLAEGDHVVRRLSKIAIAARPRERRRTPEPDAARRQAVDRQGGRRGGAGVFRPQKVRWPCRMKSLRDIRVIPVVLVAIAGLAVLKVAGLVIDGGYVFDYQLPSSSPSPTSWAQDNLNFPGGRRIADPADTTGSVDEAKDEKPKEEAAKPAEPVRAEASPRATVVYPEPSRSRCRPPSARSSSGCSRGARSSMRARAKSTSAKACSKAAEKRIESRSEEMKATESRISAATEQKTEADNARFKGIVTMYEGMKPKDAAKVFDRLEMPVLIEIASQIAPRKMSDILGLMQPEAAERLTVEMARRASGDKSPRQPPSCPRSRARCCRKRPTDAGYLTSP